MSAAAAFPPKLKTVAIEDKGKFAIVTLNRPPVNGMNLEVWSDLLAAIDACEKNPKIRGAIFTSGLQKDIFTAGNDINELYSKATSRERFIQFWTAQTTCLTRLYSSRLATVAAIRGACPAGGCAFSMCCDVRIMTSDVPGAGIGLNEVALGISVPHYWVELYTRYVGGAKAEQQLLAGRQITPMEALRDGLITEVCAKADLLRLSEEALSKLLKNPDGGRILTKLSARSELAKKWQGYCQEEAENAWKMLSSPAITAVLGQVLARLSGQAPAAKAKL